MSSDNGARGDVDGALAIEPGRQALVTVSTMQTPLGLLPPRAYGNLVIVSSTSPADVEATLTEAGADVGRVGLIPISGTSSEYDGRLWTSEPVVPDDLTGLSMRLTSAMDALEPDHGWVLIDSLNPLLMYAEEDRVFRFLDHATSQARDRDLRGVYTVVRDAVEDRTYAGLCRSVGTEIDAR